MFISTILQKKKTKIRKRVSFIYKSCLAIIDIEQYKNNNKYIHINISKQNKTKNYKYLQCFISVVVLV